MSRSLPSPVRSYYWLFTIILTFLFYTTSAQQENLKREAYDPVTHVTGHNNLRKLAKNYDKQMASSDNLKPVGDDAQLRRLYEIEMLKDPATGKIPEDIRKKELAFAQRMLERIGNKAGRTNARVIEDWKARGPFNVGGRTRALALDLDNENIILAGGVSGGMWRSEDGGLTWVKTTGSNEIQSVTAIAQDPRAGFRNIWYYATGERIGNSAAAGGAFFGGNGIYKSTDGGRTWAILPATADNRPQSNTPYDLTFNLAVHPSTGHVYAATWWGIHRSTDAGSTFAEVLAGGTDSWTDLIITPGGIVYATFDSDGAPNKGIFRSADGTTWTNITPTGFPSATSTIWGRTVLGFTPTNENIVYAYADNGLGTGAAFLWRYTHSDTSPTWTNLTASLPAFGGSVGNLNTQGGYNMLIKVHPNNANLVFIGATNLYRSPNGFTSRTGMAWVGGYSPANNVSVYPNQHPDQHALLFYPSDPLRALSANDGGIHYTDNITASNAGTFPVLWTSRNNGYLTTQPYTVSFDPRGSSENLLSGFQDNGTWFTNTTTLSDPWTEAFTGDGSYNAFADNGLTRYVSAQGAVIYRLNYLSADDEGDEYVSFTRVTPAGATGFAFVAPFVLDPNEDNIMYLPAGNRIWRNDNLDAIPLFSNAATSVGWNNLANTQVPVNNTITALALSRMPANRLYYGTNRGLIYRVDNANVGDQPAVDIASGKGLPAGNINCITVDPANADRVFVVFSNYSIPSIYYTEDGGNTWTNISANLEEFADGTGTGPSVRWLAIEGNSDRYYVGTSTGLYSALTIEGASTTWTQEDVDGIGNVVVPMVRTRSDGFVAVAAHGNGLYAAKFEVTPLPDPTLTIVNPIDDYEVFVNSPPTIIDISNVFNDSDGDPITFSLINTNPSLISATLNGTLLTVSYTPGALGRGSIGIIATSGSESLAEAFTVTIRTIDNVIYNQNTTPAGTRPSQLFTDFGNALAQSADDFVIPAGQSWSIQRVLTQGAVNGTPVLNSMWVVIHKDTLGLPGRVVYNSGGLVPVSGTSNPNVELALATPASLSEGKYWISVYAQLAFVTNRQWFWRTTPVITGSQAAFQDPANLFGTGATTWRPMSTAFGGAAVDMIFTFLGAASGVPAPSAPTDLEALYSTDTKFDLTWTDNSTNELAFLIERSTDGVTFSRRTTVGPNTDAYSDTDLFDRELTYYYRVAAIGLSDTSAYSNIASTAVIPDAPVAKLASFVFPSFFIANWKPAVGAKHYELDVSADDFATFLPGYEQREISGKTDFYLVFGTNYRKNYKYRLRAVNAGGESENSNVIIVASIKNLKLDAVCSDNPSSFRRWKIRNPNPFAIEAEWGLYRSSQKGKLTVPPGESYFTSVTERGANTMIISWRDDFYLAHIDMTGSSNKKCFGSGVEVAGGRSAYEDETVETESSFVIEAWPNPTKDKFNIMIASPLEEEVEMEILGLRGEQIYSVKTQSNVIVEVDAANYTPGIYLVKAKQLTFTKTLKLVKQ